MEAKGRERGTGVRSIADMIRSLLLLSSCTLLGRGREVAKGGGGRGKEGEGRKKGDQSTKHSFYHSLQLRRENGSQDEKGRMEGKKGGRGKKGRKGKRIFSD